VRRTFPLPDVVYNHITYRRRERAQDVRKLRRYLTENNIPFFNVGYFDKWEVHNWLSQNETVAPHLPETRQFSLEALTEMCARYPRVFIKPAQGSLGRNIAVLSRHSNGGYDFRRGRRASSQVHINDLASIEKLLPKLRTDFYLIQQGLDLCRFRGHRRDFRAIMQRNQKGHWVTSKLFARVAPSGSMVANISAGGTGLPAGRSLRRCFSAAKTQHILLEIRRVSRRVCTALSETLEGNLGELGIDLGVDTSGHVWIIEVNSKPHRKVYEDMDEKPTAKRAFRRPMQFAAYLAGFRG
jgi:glutathione synthase/RimK-type ligase-like ATP-grasp enzyme